MKTSKMNFLEWNQNILVSSLKKINLNIILIIILDALFYFLASSLAIFWLKRVMEKLVNFSLPTPQEIIVLGHEKAQALLSEANKFYYLVILSFILLLLAIIFFASIIKGVIWAKTTKTKINLTLISKFLALNLIWMGFWFLLFLLIIFFVQKESILTFSVATIILGVYFTNTLYTLFMKEQKIKSIFGAIKLNVAKFHLFLLPYAVVYFLFYIIIKLTNLFKFQYSDFLLSLIIVIYAAFVRYYVSTLVLEVNKTKSL